MADAPSGLFSTIGSKLKSVLNHPTTKSVTSGVASGMSAFTRGTNVAASAVGGVALGAGSRLGQYAIDSVAAQKKPVLLLFLMIAAGFIHYSIDYTYFKYENGIVRTLMYAFAATIAISILISDNEKRKGTIRAIWLTLLVIVPLCYVTSVLISSIIPGKGSMEIILGLILMALTVVRPATFGRNSDVGPLQVFLFTAFLMPFISQGYLFNLLSSSSIATMIPNFQYVMLHYVTPMFLPVSLYYLTFFQNYIEKPLWMLIIIVALVLIFSAPFWVDYFKDNVAGSNSSAGGTTAEQKAAAIKYLDEVSASTLSYWRSGWNSTKTSTTCWWYETSGQFNSLTGKTTTDSKYDICKKTASSDGSDISDFETSVESGALSTSSMTLSPVVAAQQKYYNSQDATFLTTFKAQSFDTQLTVSPFCTFRKASTEKKDADYFEPVTSNFTIEGAAQQDIICTIRAGKLKPASSYEMTSGVTFDYVTSAYIPRYFTTTETLATFRSGSMSPSDSLLSFYGVNLKPVSKSTKGPVKIGISAENSLIVFAEQNSPNKKEFSVVVSIENQNTWKGRMLQINKILIALPKGIELKEKSSTVSRPTPPKDKPLASPEPSWSNYQCTTGSFIGNFEKLSNEVCLSDSDSETSWEGFTDLDCAHYNYYYLTPGYGSGKTAIDVGTGQESTQKPFVSCQAIAVDPTDLLAKNTNFATKSIQARVNYIYQLEQSRSFKVESLASGEQTVFSDEVLANRAFCDIPSNAYSLEPNLFYAFFQTTQIENQKVAVRDTRNLLSQKYDAFIIQLNSQLTDSERKVLLDLDCPTRSIALAAIYDDWSQVQGNPMTTGYSYGYLRANKKMIEYIKTKAGDSAYGALDAKTLAAIADINLLLNNSVELDKVLREDSLDIATLYLQYLNLDCTNSLGQSDYSCVVGKFKCGANYAVGNYASCAVSNCQYCEQTTSTNIMTLATQVAQISKTTLGVPAWAVI